MKCNKFVQKKKKLSSEKGVLGAMKISVIREYPDTSYELKYTYD